MTEVGADFLKKKYDLHNTPEVESAAKRTEGRTGQRVAQKPETRIQNYLDRFKEILERPDPEKRDRGISTLKRFMHEKFIIKPDEVPESTFLLEQRIARDLGHGDIEITDEFRERKRTQIIKNQTKSLDKWVDYLSSTDAPYPDWAKYWAFRSVVEMGKFEKKEDDAGKETARFKNRTKDTVASFPPLNPRALAQTIGVLRSRIAEKAKPKIDQQPVENKSVKLEDEEFQKLLSTEDFSKIYTQFLIEIPEYSTAGLKETRGKWVTYPEGSDATPLVKSLEGYPLEWCTADYETAQEHLAAGDFHVYYSINEDGQAVIPRLAIRMEEDQLAEVRGIAPEQNLDPYITDILEDKFKEFGHEADKYKKKAIDMKKLTSVETKMLNREALIKDDLLFLYEIDSPIQGFGNEDDPRIKVLRNQRNSVEDIMTIFECSQDQIADNAEGINEKTKVFVGKLEPGIFSIIRKYNIENIYVTFPEGRIKIEQLAIGGKTTTELQEELKKSNIPYPKAMMESSDFTTQEEPEDIELVRIRIKDLGFEDDATLNQVYSKARAIGLDLCPAEVGPQMRLAYSDQPKLEQLHIAMNDVRVLQNYPNFFRLYRTNSGLVLGGRGGGNDNEWNSNCEFVFRLPKAA